MLVSRPAKDSYRYRRRTEAEVSAAVPASTALPTKAIRRVEKVQKFWLSTVSVGDPAAKMKLPFGQFILVVNAALLFACFFLSFFLVG